MTSADPRPLPVTHAAAVFKAENLDLERVSAITRTEPTLSYRRGDAYSIKGVRAERRFGLWVYSTRGVIRSPSLERHLEALETRILGADSGRPDRTLSKIRALVEERGVQFRVDVFWYGAAGAAFPGIGDAFRSVVSEAGGVIETDLHRDEARVA